VVTGAGGRDGEVGDVAVTECRDAVLAVWTGDCAPIVAVDASGSRLVAAHAGWRGVAGGVIDAAVDALANDVATVVVGPTIGPCCYEFSEEDLAAVADGVRVDAAAIAGQTRSGSPALDMRAAVSAALRGRGVASSAIVHLGGCTGCDIEMYSHRVRRDPERFVTAARLHAMVPG
jgi:copper oxidase (laccase) domain-containing protein